MHDNNVIHSDVKSVNWIQLLSLVLSHGFKENIVITDNGQAKICDFGTARILSASLSIGNLTPTEKGTILFWAPELVHASSNAPTLHSEKTDVWAFGMTIYVSENCDHKKQISSISCTGAPHKATTV